MDQFIKEENQYPIYKGPLFKCCYCEMAFISEEFLIKHQKKCQHSEIQLILKIQLNLKGKEIKDLFSLPQSKEVINIYSCEICCQNYFQFHEYITHMDLHKTNHIYIKNQNSISENSKSPFQCNFCQNLFIKKTDFTRHMKSHKEFKCTLCGEIFNTKNLFIKHIQLVHIGEKPFKCTICQKGFKRNCFLREHLKSHTGEKPYNCAYCSANFAYRNTLLVHLRCHEGIKPYKCTYCSKVFGRKEYLDGHIRSHTGEKPYNCIHCNMNFSLRSGLRRHLITNHSINPYTCDYCKSSFAEKTSLLFHIKKHNKKEKNKAVQVVKMKALI